MDLASTSRSPISGFKLRRQVPIGPYIVDFYCHQKKLVIELDGGQHNIGNAIQYDLRRSHFLQLQGLQVIRFWNNDVLKQKDAILQRIWDLLMTLEPSPDFGEPKSPSPKRRGEIKIQKNFAAKCQFKLPFCSEIPFFAASCSKSLTN